jgi:hypothetical protein
MHIAGCRRKCMGNNHKERQDSTGPERPQSKFCCDDFCMLKLEASASSGRAGAMGETTGHATGHITGSGACRLLL